VQEICEIVNETSSSSGFVCTAELNLTGCEMLEPCEALGDAGDALRLDVEDCEPSVLRNGSCELRCREPYIGTPTLARCPLGAPGLLYTLPQCRLPCDQVPVGYEKTREHGWRCMAFYSGQVLESCRAERGVPWSWGSRVVNRQ
jgi:hypothetical protein